MKKLFTISAASVFASSVTVLQAQQKQKETFPPISTLDALVVTANRAGQTLFEQIQPASVLTEDQLLLRVEPTLGETLNRLPGVSSTGFAPGASVSPAPTPREASPPAEARRTTPSPKARKSHGDKGHWYFISMPSTAIPKTLKSPASHAPTGSERLMLPPIRSLSAPFPTASPTPKAPVSAHPTSLKKVTSDSPFPAWTPITELSANQMLPSASNSAAGTCAEPSMIR